MAKKDKNTVVFPSSIKLTQLAILAKVDYFSLYNRSRGRYKSELSDDKKTLVVNALIKDIAPFLNDLGFDVTIRQITQ